MNDRDYDQTIQGFGGLMSPPSSSDSSFEYDDADAQFASRISSLPQRPSSPSAHSDSSLSDEEIENSLGRILDHRPSIASLISTISMEDQEKIEALEKSNKDMARKLMEAERTLQNRMVQHESELADMESRLEEVRSELSATKREEKELRGKEVCNWLLPYLLCKYWYSRFLYNFPEDAAESDLVGRGRDREDAKAIG